MSSKNGWQYDMQGDDDVMIKAHECIRRVLVPDHHDVRVNDIVSIARGNYTYVEVALAVNNVFHVGSGFSKARPTDKYNAEIGFNIALKRAIEDAIS